MQKYKISSTLGDGAFGTVYKATNIKTGQIVAIKKMKQKYSSWGDCIELRQVKSLRKLNHPNVMKLKQVLLVAEELYMVFEYLQSNLYEVYAKMKQEKKSFSETEIKYIQSQKRSIIYQIVDGLAHMHKSGFFHRDLKPENILICNSVVKLCDFGLVREIRSRPPFTDYVSTRWYRAPELLLRTTTYNSPVDIFAIGCIMAQLYTQTPLFPGTNQIDQMNKIVQVLGTPDKSDWPEGYKMSQAKNYYFPSEIGVNLSELIPQASMEAIQMLEQMLQYSSRKRPTAAEILKHEYFKDVKIPQLGNNIKQVVFEQQPKGTKLNTQKQDKNIDIFRSTKQKFKQTRKHDAEQNNPFKQNQMRKSNLFIKQKHTLKQTKTNDLDDLDSLIKQLQEKGKNKPKEEKLPSIQNRQKYHTYSYPDKKLSYPITQPLRAFQKEQWKVKHQIKKQVPSFLKYGDQNIKRGSQPIKFSYSFQPTLNPIYAPSMSNIRQTTNLGYSAFSKQQSIF